MIFIGDCRTILDESDVFGDATEIAQCVDNSEPISVDEFNSLCQFNCGEAWEYGKNDSIIWAYDPNNDIHYFFS